MATSQSRREAAEGLLADLRHIVGERLRALTVYDAGSTNGGPADPEVAHTLALVERLSGDDLSRFAALMPDWRRRGLAVPILMTPAEFGRSLDAFPLEFNQILADHEPVAGAEAFEGLTVTREDLRRACETQTKSHLLHLRQGYLEAAGDTAAITRLVELSAAPLRALLVNIAQLKGRTVRDTPGLLDFVERELMLPADGLRAVLAPARQGRMDGPQTVDGFSEYLRDVESLASTVDKGL